MALLVLTRTSCRRQCSRLPKFNSLAFSTYYDSQSGLHVPIHNEKEISIILDKRKEHSSESFVPAHLYKENAGSDMPDKIKSLQKDHGVHGLILPPPKFPRDERNLNTLSQISPPDFTLFSYTAPLVKTACSNVTMLLNYTNGSDTSLNKMLKHHTSNQLRTCLVLGADCLAEESQDPILLANDVASMIDACGGGNYIWVSCPGKTFSMDHVVRICEELMYLDLPGTTVKSRLVVDATDDEVVEETMMLGVNKFIVENEESIKIIKDVAASQSKVILTLE